MKKVLLSFLALVFVAQFMWAGSVTPKDQIPAYYSAVDNTAGSSLWTAVYTTAKKGFTSLSYGGLWTAYAITDCYPTDPSHPDYNASKEGKIWDMYSNCTFVYGPKKSKGDQCGTYSKECDCYNREHSIPKSWFGGSESQGTPGTDIFHIVPTDGKVNGVRSNNAFGEVDMPSYAYDNSQQGTPKAISIANTMLGVGSVTTTAGTNIVFEPDDQYKGDFARGYLGTLLKWNKDYQAFTSGDGGLIFSGIYTAAGHWGLTEYGLALLMKWHRQDPVSQKEIDRNNGIQQTQGNRNPFIDYPYLAEFIWGEMAGETVNLDYLMPSTDPDFIPGVSDGLRRMVPPEPGAMYGVTWSANGEVLYTDSLAEETPILVLPETPVSCSTESDMFMGWTTTAIDSIAAEAPAVLYVVAADFPVVTADVTYYAVFAKQEGEAYSRYITSCQEPQEVELVSSDEPARKVLVNGQIYILLNNRLFTIQGQRVK